MRAIITLVFIFIALISTGCGGGGGGADATSLSLDKKSLEFQIDSDDQPRSQSVHVTFKGEGMIVGFAPGVSSPSWLEITQQDLTSSSATISFQVNTTALGSMSTTVRFITGKQDGTGLKIVDLPISVKVTRMRSDGASYSGNFVYGAARSSENVHTSIASVEAWTAVSEAPWLTVLTPSGTGSGAIDCQVDVANLTPGVYTTYLTVTAKNNPANRLQLSYIVTVVAPSLTLAQSSVVIGGDTGRSPGPQDFSFSLNTGSNSYPYSLTLITDSGGDWLSSSSSGGSLNDSSQTVQLSGDLAAVVGGTYTGIARVEVVVAGIKLSAEAPVIFNKEAKRIVVSATGVAFSSLPNSSLLTRKLKVLNANGRDDIPWTATSDQPWLTVTAAGTTGAGANLSLTAARGTLAAGVYFANVSVKSSDISVENQETIRVGFTVSDTPSSDLSVELKTNGAYYGPYLVASPVEPLMFSTMPDYGIKAYNIYTGVEERSFSGIVQVAGGITISGDGTRLYVYDIIKKNIVEMDSTSGAVLHRYPDKFLSRVGPERGIAYMRLDGRPILLGNSNTSVYDLTSQLEISLADNNVLPDGLSLSQSENPSLVANERGQLFQLSRSILNGGAIYSTMLLPAAVSQDDARQACINAEATRLYRAERSSGHFLGTNLNTLAVDRDFSGAVYGNSIACGWNGLVVGGTYSTASAEDIFIYDDVSGKSLGNKSSLLQATPRGLLNRTLVLSGDLTRLITYAHTVTNLTTGYVISFQSLPANPQL